MDNAVDGIIMLNLMDRAIDNKFKKINQTDPYYAQKLQEHAREKEINKNLKDMIMNLSYSMREPNENTLVLTNKLKEVLNQPIQTQNQGAGVPTGGAAMISYVDKEFDRVLNIEINAEEMFIPNLKSYAYYSKLNKMFEKEVGDFLKANVPNPKSYSNDIRHQYVSALYTRNLGEEQAKWLGNLNEWTELIRGNGSGTEDSKIDQINNEIGRNYGLKYPTIPREQLLKILLNDWEKNYRYIKTILKNMD